MTDTISLPSDFLEDVAPTPLSGKEDSAPLQCAEPGCTNAVVKPARGRTPKYCPEHKEAKASTSTARKAGFKGSAELEASLTQYVEFLGTGVSLLDPYDGNVIAVGGKDVVHELVLLAGTDMKLRKLLQTMAAPGKYGGLTLAVFGIVFPIAMHHGLIPQLSLFGNNDVPSGGEL